MIQTVQLILLFLISTRADLQLSEGPDDLTPDRFTGRHKHQKIGSLPEDSDLTGILARLAISSHGEGKRYDDQEFGAEKRRWLLRSDLGKKSYDTLARVERGRDVLLEEAERGAQTGERDKEEKRSNGQAWRLWQLKEGWKKRPMLRGDLGKRQMIRSDLG